MEATHSEPKRIAHGPRLGRSFKRGRAAHLSPSKALYIADAGLGAPCSRLQPSWRRALRSEAVLSHVEAARNDYGVFVFEGGKALRDLGSSGYQHHVAQQWGARPGVLFD